MAMKRLTILFVDFFDSFSHNIVQYIFELGHDVVVKDYLELIVDPGIFLEFDLVILGPGPGNITDYTRFCNVLKSIGHKQLFLGICLGHQILGVINGYKLKRLDSPIHGVSIPIPLTYSFLGIDCGVTRAMFYNSWSLVSTDTSLGHLVYENSSITLIDLPNALGLQFHPESVGTSCPYKILDNALRLVYNKNNEDSNEDHWSLRSKNNSTTQRTKDL